MKSRFNLQFFSSGGGQQKVRKRDPEPEGLTKIRQGLLDKIYPGLENYNADSWKTAQDTANNAMNLQNSLLSQLSPSLEKSSSLTDEMANIARTCNIPSGVVDRLNASVNTGLQSSMGSMLNGLANRGVLNSSVTSQGINGLSNAAANAFNQNYMNAYQATLSGLGQSLQGAQNNTASLLSGLQAAGSIPSQAYEGAYAGLMPAYSFWKDWQSSYDNREDYDTIVKQGK